MTTAVLPDPKGKKELPDQAILEILSSRIVELQWRGMGYPSSLKEAKELKELRKEYDVLANQALARTAIAR